VHLRLSDRTHASYSLATEHFYDACALDTCAHTSQPRNLRIQNCDPGTLLLQAVRHAT